MSLVTEGQSHFSGFALCLYYNADFGYVKTTARTALFSLCSLIILPAVPQRKSSTGNESDPGPDDGLSIFSWCPSSPDTAFLAYCHRTERLFWFLWLSVVGGWTLQWYWSYRTDDGPFQDTWNKSKDSSSCLFMIWISLDIFQPIFLQNCSVQQGRFFRSQQHKLRFKSDIKGLIFL